MNSHSIISRKRPIRVLLAGGGTGGHAYPAIAIADAIRTARPDAVIAFAGSPDKIEFRVVPQAGYAIHPITVQGLQRKLTAQNLLMPLRVAKGIKESVELIQEFDADVVVGTGGFVAMPVLLAARYLVRPIVIQEQNAFMGLTNRVASRFAQSIHIAFEEARPKKTRAKVYLSGNPVRSGLAGADKSEGKAFYGLDHAEKILLIFGGSLGSMVINQVVGDLIGSLLAIPGLGIIWQTGDRYYDRYEKTVAAHPRLKLVKYIDRMDLAMAASDLAVCRSGASTCAELMLTRTPSIMVPSPNVAEDHQAKNAQSIERNGACTLLPEKELKNQLVEKVVALVSSDAELKRMAAKASGLAKPHAAKEIAADVILIAESHSR